MSNNTISYLTFGAEKHTCQLPRIIEGFTRKGLLLNKVNPSFIYANDSGGYKMSIAAKKQSPKSKLILNVLDIPEHLPNVNQIVNEYRENLKYADSVTCISKFVQNQLTRYLGVNSEVVYNPIQNVNPYAALHSNDRPYDLLFVGRFLDPNKRFELALQSARSSLNRFDLVTQDRHYGIENFVDAAYYDISANELNAIYHSHRILLFLSRIEGLGLPPIEAFICGCVPVLSADNETAKEFFDEKYFCYPNTQSVVAKIKDIHRDPDKYLPTFNDRVKLFEQFHFSSISDNILKVYEKI